MPLNSFQIKVGKKLVQFAEQKMALAAFDRQFRQNGIRFLAGIDEAGRGPLAGPVVAAAVILEPNVEIPGLNDSKKLSASRREKLFDQIQKVALSFGIASASVEEIQRLNILQATFLAMQRALEKLIPQPDFILVDGRDFPLFSHSKNGEKMNGRAVVKGDGRSQVIAAASILAKVQRDRIMEEYARLFPQYGFEKHKGYGTKAHREKIVQLGPCPIHRRKFIRRLMQEQTRLF